MLHFTEKPSLACTGHECCSVTPELPPGAKVGRALRGMVRLQKLPAPQRMPRQIPKVLQMLLRRPPARPGGRQPCRWRTLSQ